MIIIKEHSNINRWSGLQEDKKLKSTASKKYKKPSSKGDPNTATHTSFYMKLDVYIKEIIYTNKFLCKKPKE